jgi:hypothetical protein
MPFSVEHRSRNVAVVRCNITNGKDWSQRFLLRSDAHNDNPHSDRAMQVRHLDEAIETNAGIIDAGDMMCVMQGKFDKRANKADMHPDIWNLVKPEQEGGENLPYLDAVVKDTADFYTPYAHNWIVVGQGNHETAIKKRHETCLTTRVVERMNTRAGARVQAGGYSGWVWFQFKRGSERMSKRMWYFHGSGGGGPVTKGVIQTNRRAAFVRSDFILTGHIHESWNVTQQTLELNSAGEIVQGTCEHISTPTYKEEFGNGEGGWHIETGKPPKPVGAYWLEFYWTSRRGLRHRLYRAD